MCLLLASRTKRSKCETNPEIKKASEQNEAYDMIKGLDHQSSLEMLENVAHKRVEQQPSLIAPSVYETIN